MVLRFIHMFRAVLSYIFYIYHLSDVKFDTCV